VFWSQNWKRSGCKDHSKQEKVSSLGSYWSKSSWTFKTRRPREQESYHPNLRLLYVLKTSLHSLSFTFHKSLWVDLAIQLWWTSNENHQELRKANAWSFEIHEIGKCGPLRPEAWKYFVSWQRRRWWRKDINHWPGFKLLFKWKTLYVHLKLILQSSRNHTRNSLHIGNRYVVIWLHSDRVICWIPNISRWKWKGIISLSNAILRCTTCWCLRTSNKRLTILWWESWTFWSEEFLRGSLYSQHKIYSIVSWMSG